jgi:hypothetical protein
VSCHSAPQRCRPAARNPLQDDRRRLRGHVADDRDLFDMFEFQRAATSLLGAEINAYSDRAPRNDHVSTDLATATPL